MKREDILKILVSLTNDENRKIVAELMYKVNNLSDEQIKAILNSVGNSRSRVTAFIKDNISKQLEKEKEKNNQQRPINKMFTYGISGKTIHLHMPVKLMDEMKTKGITGTVALVNLYLLDALDKLKELKNSGNREFKDKNQIYMISPILIDRELKFLDELDFATKLYSKKDLQSNIFLLENKEAQLAVTIFGNQKNVGTASISFDTLNNERWAQKKEKKVKELESKGYSIQELDEIE